ncbi:MAG: PHP domain-containing protein [Candidatus Heimdallarchaeota archaeon]|nr:PHP domain-containing protein [Candidatus Heimdallarchaeota archaeon]
MSLMNSKQPEQRFVDLHTHSTASDGTFTPTELIQYAVSKDLAAVAITDHDTVAGIPEGIQAAKKYGIEFVPGIELSTEIKTTSIHIVGLYINHRNQKLLDLCDEINHSREKRAEKIIAKINTLTLGPAITMAEVKSKAHGLIGRPHIAEIMIEKGFVQSIDEAFKKYLARGAPGYVPRFKLTPSEGVSFLKTIGAIPILAHPGILPEKFPLESLIKTLLPKGLAGLEVEYFLHPPERKGYLRSLVEKYDLVESGGSDCHGHLNGGPFLGTVDIPYEILATIKERFGQ